MSFLFVDVILIANQILNRMSKEEVYFDIPVNISDPLEQRIYDAFTVYDHRYVNMVDAIDVGNILRFLGCVPSEEDVKEIVKETEFSDHPGDVHLSNFMPYVKQLLLQDKLKSAPPESVPSNGLKKQGFHSQGGFRSVHERVRRGNGRGRI
jgi:hypothetical protein